MLTSPATDTHMRAFDDVEAPDYVEPVVGWRTWFAVSIDGEVRLVSPLRRTVWAPLAPIRARCELRQRGRLLGRRRRPIEHAAPGFACTCGVYAADALDTALEYAIARPILAVRALAVVAGPVSLWGEVVECSGGWRASRAYPARLYVLAIGRGRTHMGRNAAPLARALSPYGVPVSAVHAAPHGHLRAIWTRELGSASQRPIG